MTTTACDDQLVIHPDDQMDDQSMDVCINGKIEKRTISAYYSTSEHPAMRRPEPETQENEMVIRTIGSQIPIVVKTGNRT